MPKERIIQRKEQKHEPETAGHNPACNGNEDEKHAPEALSQQPGTTRKTLKAWAPKPSEKTSLLNNIPEYLSAQQAVKAEMITASRLTLYHQPINKSVNLKKLDRKKSFLDLHPNDLSAQQDLKRLLIEADLRGHAQEFEADNEPGAPLRRSAPK
jgi:hypothetical protein